jgi:hypothetical protein
MTAHEVRKRISAFRDAGQAGQIVLNYGSAGLPGKKSKVTSVEVHIRLEMDRGEPDDGILDTAAGEV